MRWLLSLPAPSRGGPHARHSRSFHAVFVVTATAMALRGASRAGSAFLLPARLRSASASYEQAVYRGCPARPAGTQTRSRRVPPERRRGGGRGLTADEHHGTGALVGLQVIAWTLVAAAPGATGPGPPARRHRPTTGPSQPRAAPGGCPGSARRSANRKRGRGGCRGDGSAAATRRAASWQSPAGAANEEAALWMGAAILRGRPEGRGLGCCCSAAGSGPAAAPELQSGRPESFPGLVAPGPPTGEAVVPLGYPLKAVQGCHGRSPGGSGTRARLLSFSPPAEVRSRRLCVFLAVFETNYAINRENFN